MNFNFWYQCQELCRSIGNTSCCFEQKHPKLSTLPCYQIIKKKLSVIIYLLKPYLSLFPISYFLFAKGLVAELTHLHAQSA